MMNATTQDDDARLDGLLDRSAPRTPVPGPADEQVLLQMALAARDQARPVRWPKSARRTAGLAMALGLGLGGAGLGAAAVAGVDLPWSPWAQDPDVVLTYTLPSGATCEQRLGNAESPDPARIEALREYVSTHDLLALADIDGTIAEMRSEQHVVSNDGGRPVEYAMSADYEYRQAVTYAVAVLVFDELARQGFDDDTDMSFMGEAHCPGAQW